MRVAMPHMGNIYIPFKALFQRLKVDFVMPPVNNQRTLSLGARYSPEGLCIPFKMTLGNLIEAAELGANTMLMPGGNGICRLGYYTKVQEQILRDLGYDVEVIQVGVSELGGIGGRSSRFATNHSGRAVCWLIPGSGRYLPASQDFCGACSLPGRQVRLYFHSCSPQFEKQDLQLLQVSRPA